MAFTFFIVATLSGGNDVIADKFHISLNATTWAGRIGLVILPPLMYYIAVRTCLGLQQHDREVLAHGVETGIIKRAPDGRFYEVHQPLGPVDDHGHPIPLDYLGWTVPKKMNRVGALAPAIKGFFFPIEKPAEAPVSPAVPSVTAPERREEITSGH
jgi:ubiquinol-cytochrome c reductase cytochrome b subunit